MGKADLYHVVSLMSLTCQQLLESRADAWKEATVHPFLTQCADGTILPQQFNTWLVQDYQFVTEFVRLVGRILAIAPVEHFDVILAGTGALKAELLWFRDKAQERNLTLDAPRQLTCVEYCAFMESLATAPYAVCATVFWAIELAYNQAWQLPGAMPEPYTEFADRWGNTGFTEYVKLLEKQADEALAAAPEDVLVYADAAFVKVAALEKEFWQMAYGGEG